MSNSQNNSTSNRMIRASFRRNRRKPRKAEFEVLIEKLKKDSVSLLCDFVLWCRTALGLVTEHVTALGVIIIFHDRFL